MIEILRAMEAMLRETACETISTLPLVANGAVHRGLPFATAACVRAALADLSSNRLGYTPGSVRG